MKDEELDFAEQQPPSFHHPGSAPGVTIALHQAGQNLQGITT